MKSLTSLAARHSVQMKSRETAASKHAKAVESTVNNKVETAVTYHLKSGKTKIKNEKRTSKVIQTLKAHSRAAHQVVEEVKRDKRR